MSRFAADQAARSAALNPTKSFIVQAPAGSGKTELLVQRLLTVLAHVEHPGEVLAITFTKKAAGEMRQRLIEAITAASDNNAVAPQKSPARERWQLARAVIARDAARGWQLLDRPGQLCIETFDAFARRLTTLAPIGSSASLSGLAVLDADASARYREAARAALRSDDITDATILLLHASDNRLDTLIELIADLLGKRAQWMTHLVDDSPAALAQLRTMLVTVIEQHLVRLTDCWRETWNVPLQRLLSYAALHNPDAERAEALKRASERLPDITFKDLLQWRVLQDFFQKNDGNWRKAFTVANGFPAPSEAGLSANEKLMRKTMKDDMTAFVQILAEVGGETLRQRLHTILLLPDDWALTRHEAMLHATLTVLKYAAAELIVLEQQTASTDFSGVALAANVALVQQRDEVLARLDARIRHILVDEFQDTSPAQAELIASLIEEWSDSDSHTLFIVGDPMQSIYGFRDSDVGIFLDFWHNGVRNLRLTPLTLTANYRSRPEVLQWVNRSLASVFATSGGLVQRGVPFAAAEATRGSGQSIDAVRCNIFDDVEQEADTIVSEIEAALHTNAATRIAVIVRAKRDANRIIARLLDAGIAFAAQEFSAWNERPLLRDLLSLTYLLVQPGDRLSWFAWLRSPLIGLQLSTLDQLAAQCPSVEHALAELSWQQDLDADERERIALALTMMAETRRIRSMQPLSAVVHQAWRLCGGERLPHGEDEWTEVLAFFALLDVEARGGMLPPRDAFERLIARRMQSFSIASMAHPERAVVDVLTIHRSKGLEWDIVFLPGLDRSGRNDSRELLTWQFLRDSKRHTHLLVAARETRRRSEGSVFEYVQARRKAERTEEAKRLLYVAVTRARESLHLSGAYTTIGKAPATGSLAALLADWPRREAPLDIDAANEAPVVSPRQVMVASLTRLPLPDPIDTMLTLSTAKSQINFISSERGDASACAIGIVGHKLLEGLARARLRAAFASDRVTSFTPSVEQVREWLLVKGADVSGAAVQAQQLVDRMMNLLQRGSAHIDFLFSPTHREVMNEMDLLLADESGQLQAMRLDRSFVTVTGERWVVDYKFSEPSSDQLSLDLWLEQQRKRYASQLMRYKKALLTMDATLPVHAALYFPWLDRLLEIDTNS